MTQEKEALKLALEYMNEYYPSYAKQAAHHHRVNTAIKEALAQPEQIPPSAYSNTHQPEPPPECPMDSYGDGNVYRGQRSRDSVVKTITLAQPERKPLSDYVNSAGINANDSPHIVLEKLERAIEAAHGIKE